MSDPKPCSCCENACTCAKPQPGGCCCGPRCPARVEALRSEAESGTDEQVATCACSLGLLGGLRDDYEQILRRVDIEEESLVSAAASLGITANNATVRLHRARKELRAKLLRYCNTRSVASCLDCSCESATPNPGVSSGTRS